MTITSKTVDLDSAAKRHADRKAAFLTHFGFYVICNLAMFGWDTFMAASPRLRIYPLFGWGAGVLFHGLLVYAHAPGANWRNLLLGIDRSPSRYPRLRQLAVHAMFNALFCIATALIITYLMRVGTLQTNIVFSICIGTIAWLGIDGPRLLIWGFNKPNKYVFFAIAAVAVFTAKNLGSRLAINILGLPQEAAMRTQEQNEAGFLLLTILTALFGIWFFWTRGTLEHFKAEAEAEKARAANIEKQAVQAQLQLLQAQIEPHMLFNTLANLQGLIAVDPPRAQYMLDQLIQYLRATLSSSRAEHTTLGGEFSLLRAYLELMSIRMGARLQYAIDLPDELSDIRLPPMLLQPLVENAIKHGLEPKLDGGRIDVCAVRENDMLILTVADTGLGMPPAPPESIETAGDGAAGIGNANIRDRLQVLYGERGTFALEPNQPGGVIARLTLPLTT